MFICLYVYAVRLCKDLKFVDVSIGEVVEGHGRIDLYVGELGPASVILDFEVSVRAANRCAWVAAGARTGKLLQIYDSSWNMHCLSQMVIQTISLNSPEFIQLSIEVAVGFRAYFINKV